MKKYIGIWLLVTVGIMFLLPWLTVSFAGSAGMAICFILFYVINPVYSVIIGCAAGKNVRKLWILPVASAVLFLLSTWILFEMGEVAFVMYAGIYLILGMIAMLISAYIKKKSQNKVRD